jgi:lipopolysaccharide/colanic/teichoic acid biosynthesis glycosyltransferase
MLKIYTPKDSEQKVKDAIDKLDVKYVINDTKMILCEDDVVLHYRSKLLDDDTKDMILEHIQYGYKVSPLIDYLDKSLGYNEITLLNSDYFLHRKSFGALSSKRRKTIKRVGALFNATVLGVLFSPIMIITAIAIKLESSGPVFYRQKRVGQFNREFYVYKFRSMTFAQEHKGSVYTSKDDVRVTKVGKFIRKTRIDELPQIINMIKGEMNLIGPRPEWNVISYEYSKSDIPFYKFRHAVKPGITGYAQVKYPYGASVEDAKWKHRYDMYYIKYQSLWMDVKIIFMTVKVVLFGMGR